MGRLGGPGDSPKTWTILRWCYYGPHHSRDEPPRLVDAKSIVLDWIGYCHPHLSNLHLRLAVWLVGNAVVGALQIVKLVDGYHLSAVRCRAWILELDKLQRVALS